MKSQIISTCSGHEGVFETDSYIADEGLLKETAFYDVIVEIAIEYWQALDDSQPVFFLSEMAVWEAATAAVKNAILDSGEEFCVISQLLDDSGNVIQNKTLSYRELLLDYIDSIKGEFMCCAPVCNYLEQCMVAFMEEATWHWGVRTGDGQVLEIDEEFGFRKESSVTVTADGKWLFHGCLYEPVLWYGVAGSKPEEPWMITVNAVEEQITFLESIGDGDLSNVGDFSKEFVFCFGRECGCCLPDVDEFLLNLPVEIGDLDTEMGVDEISKVFYRVFKRERCRRDYI